jgi:hypothetical protein
VKEMNEIKPNYISILIIATLILSLGTFYVLANVPDVSASNSAGITISPLAGFVKTPITVTGKGFTPGASVDIIWFGYVASSQSLGYYPIKTGIVAGSDGAFKTVFNAPFDFGVNVQHNVNATQNGVGTGISNSARASLPRLLARACL